MPYVPFHNYFPEIAEKETRTLTVLPNSDFELPPASYSLLEMYCDEHGCDCRRVFLYVTSSLREDVEAVIAYGWEDKGFYARWLGDDDPEMLDELQGPALNFGSPQTDLAPAILDMVKKKALSDPLYVERLKRHYKIFREEVDRKKYSTIKERNLQRKKRRQKQKKKKKKKKA